MNLQLNQKHIFTKHQLFYLSPFSPFSVAEPSNYTISFCDFPRHFALTKGDFICLFCLPSAFCLTIVGFSEFRFRAVLAKSVMASDPTSSSLNISGSSQSVLGGAVAVRSRSASSGHTSQNSTPRKRSNRKSNQSLVGALKRIPKAKSLMPPPPARAMDFEVEEEIPSQSACAGIPQQREVERTTDVKVLNQLVVGLDPNEVFAALQSRVNGKESTLQNLPPIKCTRKQVR